MKKIYFLVLVLAALVTACELPDNIDPKAPTSVPASTLVTNAEVDLTDVIDEISQNVNVSRFLCQYASQVQYTDPSRYFFSDRQIPDGYWDETYLTLRDFLEARNLIGEESGSAAYNRNRDNKLAIIDIMEVYLYHNLVDYFGNVPYTDALGGYDNKTASYDDAAAIYQDLHTRLSDDIATLTAGADDGSFGSSDLFFGGDVAMWKKTAASLKLRLALRLAAVDVNTATTEATAAITAGLFEAGEGMVLNWLGESPYVNTIYNRHTVDNRNDYAPSKTIIDIMLNLNDPRVPFYFAPVDTSAAGTGKYAYIGLEYGLVSNENYQKVCHWSDAMFQPDYPTTLIDFVEVQFLLAEVAQRAGDPGQAETFYNAGITASIVQWGGTEADAATYLAQAEVAYDAARWKELLGTQKWIALYNRGNEGYATYRLFDWPVMHPPTDYTQADIPMRMPYPFNEPDLNLENYTAAAAAIGGDDVRTLVFWDTTPNSATPSPN